LGIECRAGDQPTLSLLAQINDVTAQLEAIAERAFLSALEGGCNLPAAALARAGKEEIVMTGAYQPQGRPLQRLTLNGPTKPPPPRGRELPRGLREGVASGIRGAPRP